VGKKAPSPGGGPEFQKKSGFFPQKRGVPAPPPPPPRGGGGGGGVGKNPQFFLLPKAKNVGAQGKAHHGADDAHGSGETRHVGEVLRFRYGWRPSWRRRPCSRMFPYLFGVRASTAISIPLPPGRCRRSDGPPLLGPAGPGGGLFSANETTMATASSGWCHLRHEGGLEDLRQRFWRRSSACRPRPRRWCRQRSAGSPKERSVRLGLPPSMIMATRRANSAILCRRSWRVHLSAVSRTGQRP